MDPVGKSNGLRERLCEPRGVDLVNRKVFENELDLGVVREDAAHGIVEISADRAFKVRKLDDSDRSPGIAEDGGAV